MGILRLDLRHILEEISFLDPFFHQVVGRLGIHVDHPFSLFYRDQVPLCLPLRVSRPLHIYTGPRL